MAKFCQHFKMAKCCHLENVIVDFTDSYLGDCQNFKMAKYCHLGVLAMAVKTCTTCVTQMLVRQF